MRFMILVKATEESEAGAMRSQEILAEMGRYNEELAKAGVMLAGEGLHPTSKGARVRFSGSNKTVIDGPFTETKELLGPPLAGQLDHRLEHPVGHVPVQVDVLACRRREGRWAGGRRWPR
jgi:hypothetical protein